MFHQLEDAESIFIYQDSSNFFDRLPHGGVKGAMQPPLKNKTKNHLTWCPCFLCFVEIQYGRYHVKGRFLSGMPLTGYWSFFFFHPLEILMSWIVLLRHFFLLWNNSFLTFNFISSFWPLNTCFRGHCTDILSHLCLIQVLSSNVILTSSSLLFKYFMPLGHADTNKWAITAN